MNAVSLEEMEEQMMGASVVYAVPVSVQYCSREGRKSDKQVLARSQVCFCTVSWITFQVTMWDPRWKRGANVLGDFLKRSFPPRS